MKQSVIFLLLNCFHVYYVCSSNLPGPLVYVVTPSSKSSSQSSSQWKNGPRTAPFYYSNWMKRMDSPSSSTPASTTEETKTPDLIFAEFESDNSNMKSIRKLLEKENIELQSTSTTSQPIYVPEEDTASESDNGLFQSSTEEPKNVDMTDYFALYNNLYNTGVVYVPNSPSTSVPPVPTSTTYSITTSTTELPMDNVESVWHIIDSEKHDEYSNKWQETAINSEESNDPLIRNNDQNGKEISKGNQSENDNGIDENFALPGFGTNAGNGGENESRAIRTESNIRFPYVNLKPFMMKDLKTKKVNNMFNLDSFTEIKNPVRGEAQDNPMVSIRQPIDRYNPAQPYIPEYGIGTKKTKQPSASRPTPVAAPQPPPTKTVANLVPPPPPPPPKLTADDFPTPSTYESFPPYAPNGPGVGSMFSFPFSGLGPDSSDSDNDGPPSGPSSALGGRYKPPSPPTASASPFVPTLPPLNKPFPGYSYTKPLMVQEDSPPAMDTEDKPDFQGYHYSKPMLGFSYDKPPSTQSDSQPAMDTHDKPDFHGFNKPMPSLSLPSEDHHSPTYGYHDAPPPSYHPESDYPDLIFDKPHGSMGDMKGGNDIKSNDVGMMPPPPPSADNKPDSYEPPMDDHGFPHDFPSDFKYAHDFDEHDYHHHHHTTTTTTEMPRVNRYSYYYLGKKLYYLPLYFSVYFVVYVGALIIKAVLRHKITYPNSFRPGNDPTASFFSKRSIDSHLTNENLHEITSRVTRAIATAAEKYLNDKSKHQ